MTLRPRKPKIFKDLETFLARHLNLPAKNVLKIHSLVAKPARRLTERLISRAIHRCAICAAFAGGFS